MPFSPRCALKLALVAEVDQGVEVLVGHQPDAAAVAAVAAVGAAQRNELLAAEADAAIAAVAGVTVISASSTSFMCRDWKIGDWARVQFGEAVQDCARAGT
jgi:type IV secretory pathway TrbL component